MVTARADGYNIRPATDITLTICVVSHGHHGSVGFQAYSMVSVRADGYNIRPATDITLATCIPPCGDYGTIRFQTHGMVTARADGYNIRPAADITLAICIQPRGYYGTIGFQTHRMVRSRADSLTALLQITHRRSGPDNNPSCNNQKRENGGDHRQALPGLTGRSARMLGFF